MSEWLPIESAPMDGTTVLLCSKKGRVASGEFKHQGWANPKLWVWPYINMEPVYWMPLPPPPKEPEPTPDTLPSKSEH